ncbi:MAG: hypothetical protein AVDCRST_MAG95-2469 [uncultured Adhaeribacter sp.]|uniref:Secretion system C-terminal sorting domain-containing protein n=1 Tax=uncultured Adhaeribacter sp. TaxID=448109 RepID=A0A6J4IXM4_9BACT|nr:MAG: hypothetical protein AVDCRST_MAG95-2469 [uncultured Adhaeribacter sp.]
MTKYLASFLVISLLGIGNRGWAQQYYELRYQNDVNITVGSQIMTNPWSGGLNSAVISKIDLNQDGTEDLFIYDRTQNKITTYVAQQVNGQWQWVYRPDYEALFPADLTDWVLLRDYNNDGRKDIFTKTNLGIKVYRNTTSTPGPLTFALADDFIRFNNGVNLQVSGDNLPAITDMDNDGDLDILCFDFAAGHTMQLYNNRRVEDKLAADSLRFKLEDAWWGKLTKCEDACGSFVFNSACRTTGTKHSEPVSILAIDLDNDLDKDLLISADRCTKMVKITNQGTPTKAVMSSSGVESVFPANTTPADFQQYPAAYYEDVTFDGVPDLIVSPFVPVNTDLVDTRQSVWLYRNTAAVNAAPVFSFVQSDFLQNKMVDVGEDSAPAFADVDADGDQDMVVGNYATLRNGAYSASISLYTNIGTATQPQFRLVTDDYANLSELKLQGLKPRFADVNGDGSLDLTFATATGTSTGTNKYILNSAPANQPFNFNIANLKSLPVATNVEDTALFYDLDGDSDQDVLVGTSLQVSGTSGPLLFYRNTGTATNPVYTLANEAFGGIQFDEEEAIRTIYPLISDLNNDNAPELLVANNQGQIKIYPSFMADLNGTFTESRALFANAISPDAIPGRLGAHLSLAAADLDGNQQPEIIVGNAGGGLFYLTQQLRQGTGIGEEEKPQVTAAIFPNPASTAVTIRSPEKVTVALYNSAGQQIYAAPQVFAQEHQLPVAGWAPGLYFVQVRNKQAQTTGYKLLIER